MPRTKAVSRLAANNGKVEFDPKAHIYRYNGQKVPSVTQILGAAGISFDFSRIDPLLLSRKRALGIALHACLHFYHQRDLDWESLDPEVRERFEAYVQFVKDTGFIADKAELRMWPEVNGMRYGGCLDVTGLINGEPHLIDFKSSSGPPSYAWGIQESAYMNGIPAPLIPPFHYHRSSLQLLEGGKYHWKQWPDNDGDWEEFKAALFLVHRRINRGEDIWR